MEKEKEEFVVTALNNVMLQLSEVSVKLNVLTNMVLGVYSETLPADVYANIYTNFVDQLHQQLFDVLNHSDDVLLESGSLLLKKKTEVVALIQSMKSSDFYRKSC